MRASVGTTCRTLQYLHFCTSKARTFVLACKVSKKAGNTANQLNLAPSLWKVLKNPNASSHHNLFFFSETMGRCLARRATLFQHIHV
jgi:hypothetical protein